MAMNTNLEVWQEKVLVRDQHIDALKAESAAFRGKVRAVLLEMQEYMEGESYTMLTPDGAGIFHLVEEYASKLEDALGTAE